MIANIVLGMLLVWFTCVLVITVRAGAAPREQDARAVARTLPHRVVDEETGASLRASGEAPATPAEAPDAISASLTL